MSLDGIIFDPDGTLADTLPVCIQAYQATVHHFCGQIPEESEIYARFGLNDEGVLEAFIPGQLDQTLPYYLDCYEQFHAQCPQTFTGIDQVFTILKAKGIRTAIVTGKGSQSAAISMRILGLTRWVDIIETGFAHKADKPHSIGLVLHRWGLPPGQAAYVGDAPSDILAARQAGLLPMGAAWAKTSLLRNEPLSQDYPIFYEVDRFIQWIMNTSQPNNPAGMC